MVELKKLLESYYPEVILTANINAIDWRFPVVSLGGPLPNRLTAEIGENGLLPLWFLGLPYSQDTERVIGSSDRAAAFSSVFDKDDNLVEDVGFVARLRSPQSAHQFLYVIAGNYGSGTLGVVKHLSSTSNLRQLRVMTQGHEYFQAIIGSEVAGWEIIDTKLMYCRSLS